MESAPDVEGQPLDGDFAPAWHAVCRGVAFFLGVFTLLNLAGEVRWSGFDSSFWWIDLRPSPPRAARGFLAVTSVLLVVFAFRPQIDGALRSLALSAVLLLLMATLWNAYGFYALLRADEIRTDIPVPFAMQAAAALIVIFAGMRECPQDSMHLGRDLAIGSLAVLVCAISFPLAHIFCTGSLDERSASDAVIVFADDLTTIDPSSAGMQTATDLHREGLAPRLVLATSSETTALEASQPGETSRVPANWDIVTATDASSIIEEVASRCAELQIERVMVVANFHQLPRIDLLFRQRGFEVVTVPINDEAEPPQSAAGLATEVAKLWSIYLGAFAD